MTREYLIQEFSNRGIKAKPIEAMKNGIKVNGISFGEGHMQPTVYEYDYEPLDEEDFEYFYESICGHLETSKDYDTDFLLKWDSVKDGLQLCVQRQSEEDLIKKPFADLELYVRAVFKEIGSYKVTPEILKSYGITEEELFETAKANSLSDIVISPLDEILKDIPKELFSPDLDHECPLYIITNHSRSFGAFPIGLPEVLDSLAEKLDSDLVIFPSSIHECLICPTTEADDYEYFNYMVQNINESAVHFEERLQDHIYYYSKEEKQLEIKNSTPIMTM